MGVNHSPDASWNCIKIHAANTEAAVLWLLQNMHYREEMFKYKINQFSSLSSVDNISSIFYIKDDKLAVEFKLRVG